MKNENSTKTCQRCGCKKPLTDFGVQMRNADGRDSYCLECRREVYRSKHGGTARMLSKFTDAQLLAELQRRNAIAQKLDELGKLVAPEYTDDDSLSSEDTDE